MSICYVVICNEFCIDCRKLFIVCIRKRCRIVLWNRNIKRTTPFPRSRFSSRIGELVRNISLEINVVKLLPITLLNICYSLFVYLLGKYHIKRISVLLKYLIIRIELLYKFLICNLHYSICINDNFKTYNNFKKLIIKQKVILKQYKDMKAHKSQIK